MGKNVFLESDLKKKKVAYVALQNSGVYQAVVWLLLGKIGILFELSRVYISIKS